jgi:hypothetical protein
MVSPSLAMVDSALNLAFDIGHSSIGWAVLQPPTNREADPSLLGCGVVLFPADECLSSARAGFRRQRRHIAATRNRIKRLKALLNHLGVVSEAQLNQHPSPYSFPWLFAARVLASGGKQTLSWPELWAVLRWYAHNRGYDGNAAWARGEQETDEDTEKVENARGLMAEYKKESMAETICAYLGLDPLGTKLGSTKYFKGANAAFPRDTVDREVRRILEAHQGKLPKLDNAFIAALLEDWEKLSCLAIRLPQRYRGGLLFGQMIPRFDNRIIPTCRITGKKTPLKHCRAFYRYRWAMLVSNLRVKDPDGSRPLTPSERQKLHEKMTVAGAFNKTELKKRVAEITNADVSPIDQMFLVPEMEKALVFDPVRDTLSTDFLAPLWKLIPEKFQKIFAGRLFHEQRATLTDWQTTLEKANALPAGWTDTIAAQADVRRETFRNKQKIADFTRERFLNDPIEIKIATGRAPYTRELMEKAFELVFSNDPARNNPTASGGPLEETAAVLDRRLEQPITQQTNNHLVRHRLLVLERVLADVVNKYAAGDAKRIGRVTIEVVRDLQKFSGKSAQEKAKMLGEQLGHHRRIVKKLEEALAESPVKFSINYSLIKKARIADDLGWKCPFTGMEISIADLLPTGHMDREHIIPRSLRPSDSLESLVITYKSVNKMKGQRTAMQFMKECGGQAIPDLPGKELLPLSKYLAFVNSLPARGAPDDFRRCRRRKEFLLLEKYNPREADFTGRDLTQTAHLVKLANLQAQAWFKKHDAKPRLAPLAGSVTGATRKSWAVLGCLAQACPRVLDETGAVLTKTEIRDITHLHHALDAAVLALASHYLPRDGKLWELLNRRSVDDLGRGLLEKTGLFTFSAGNRPQMNDLSPAMKEQISSRLAEKRVVQHIPRKMSGLKVQQNIWRVVGAPDEDGYVPLRQAIRGADGKRTPKFREERPAKLHGYAPRGNPAEAKLSTLKGALIIEENFGIALDPEPQVMPFTQVWEAIRNLVKKNGGKPVRILRKGMVINVPNMPNASYPGLWRVHSISDKPRGIMLDIADVSYVSARDKDQKCRCNVLLKTLLKDGMTIADVSYVGA